MPSYLVTGASRGIGFALVQQLSENPDNIVIAMARNKTETESKIASEINGRKNLFVVQGDLVDLKSLQNAFTETKKITGGSLDVLIANAGLISDYSRLSSMSELAQDTQALEDDINKLFQVNVVGNIRLFNIFLPLIKNGKTKKVVAISSGMSDEKLTVEYELYEAAPYSISKSALNMVTAKFQAEFKKDGIIFMGVCPGMVDTGHFDDLPPESIEKLKIMGGKFAAYAPNFAGAATTADGARDVLRIVHEATFERNGGQLVSHLGNRQWL